MNAESNTSFPGSVGSVSSSPKDVNSDDFSTSTCSWREGRRICELGYLSDQLKCDDSDCGENLSLSNIIKETRYGFGSRLYIECTCGIVNTVETNKRHRVNNKGPKVFDINTKAALGTVLLFYFINYKFK